jgi:hypothetical protein
MRPDAGGFKRLAWVVYRDEEVRAALTRVSDTQEDVRSAARRAWTLADEGPG